MIRRNAIGIATIMMGALKRRMSLKFPKVRKFGAPAATNKAMRTANPNGSAFCMTKRSARRQALTGTPDNGDVVSVATTSWVMCLTPA